MDLTGGNSSPVPATPTNNNNSPGVCTLNQPQYIYSLSQIYMPTQTQSPPQLAYQGPTHQATGTSILTDLDIYKVVSSLRESLKDEIQPMVNLAIKQEGKPLLTEISELKSRVHYLESETDASNQYSRRNCVLISNIGEHTGEDTNTFAIKVAKEGGLTIEPSDNDRSHRIGKPGKKKSRDIVVKFVSYQSKAKFLQTL